MERRDDGVTRAINVIHCPCCGRQGAKIRHGIMILPHGLAMTDGEFLRYMLVLKRRYRRDYDAIEPIAVSTPCIFYVCWPILPMQTNLEKGNIYDCS